MKEVNLKLTVGGTEVSLAALRRPGDRTPLVCLHGFGSTKEDYADLALRSDFEDRDLVLFDAPGCGASTICGPEALSIPLLVETALKAFDALGLETVHLLGHSMGGLTALLLAHRAPDRAVSFFNIEGNLAPEDCFLSRQIVSHAADTAEAFLDGFRARVRARPEYSSALYAAALSSKVRPQTAGPIFRSMVAISDGKPLLDIMAALPCPRTFVYGKQNRHLSYLVELPRRGVEVIEIAHSAHFPMYSNPTALWDALAGFLGRSEGAS